MDITEAKILDAAEPLSKALDEILKSGTAVFVTKNSQLFGLIDDRNMRMGISDASKTKCESACIKCPSIANSAGIPERLEAFLAGHFKSLPVLNANGRIIGATTRADFIRELVSQKLVPHVQAYQHMSRPVCTVECDRTIADAKSMMKKNEVHHLVVTRGGNIAGTISTLDFAGFLINPQGRQSYQLISSVQNFDSYKLEQVMRPNFIAIDETATLEEAASKMASENVSSVVVVSQKKPVGIIAATDIFKLVKKLYEEEKDVLVSGLDQDNLAYYGRIKGEILSIVSKFDKSMKIENITVRIKKGKSIYEADTHFDLNNRHIAFKCEAYNLRDTIAAISKELKILLEKAKSAKMERKKSSALEEG